MLPVAAGMLVTSISWMRKLQIMSATEAVVRFLVGGLFVSAFAVLADLLKPKSFAGLFGAAPAIALATLSLTIGKEGASYAALEARSMVGGAFAFYVYACCVGRVMARATYSAKTIAFALLAVWFIIAAGFEIAIR
jgi:hypothetical protein